MKLLKSTLPAWSEAFKSSLTCGQSQSPPKFRTSSSISLRVILPSLSLSNNRKASETSESILHDSFRVFLDTVILVFRPAFDAGLLWDVDILPAKVEVKKA